MNEKLIAYLKAQIEPKCAILAEYNAAVVVVENLKTQLQAANDKVASFTDIDKVAADLAELNGFIESLSKPAGEAKTVEPAVVPGNTNIII